MKKGRIMALIALAFSIAALIILFVVPYLTNATGWDIMTSVIENFEYCEWFEIILLISIFACALTVILSAVSVAVPKLMIVQAITSAISVIASFVGTFGLIGFINTNSWFTIELTDVAEEGFWIVFALSFVFIIISVTGTVLAFSKKGSAPANAYDQQQYANSQKYANPYQNANSRQYGQAQPQYRNPYRNANNQQYANTQPQTERNTYYAGAQSSDQTVKYRFCTECGSRIPANSHFCLNCGTRVDDVPQQPAPEQNAQPEQPKVMQNEPAPEQNAQPEQPIIEQNAQPEQPIIEQDAQPEQAQPQTVYNETAQENTETEFSEKDFSDTAFEESKETFEEPAPVSENPEVHEENTNEQTPEEPKVCNTEERRFCMQCGNELKPGDCFCPNCGTKIE